MTFPPNSKPILYLDTTSRRLMIGMSVGEEMVFQFNEPGTSHRYHSAILAPTLAKTMKDLGIKPKNLGAIAINVGPGSFTGIRTGLAVTRTMAQFLDLPVYALNTFEIFAAAHPGKPVSVYIDALQERAYHAVTVIESEDILTLTPPELIDLKDIPGFQPDVIVYASESLKSQPHFTDASIRLVESEGPFTPQMMQRLITGYGERFQKPWDQVSALYLQEPNITLRKPKAGSLN